MALDGLLEFLGMAGYIVNLMNQWNRTVHFQRSAIEKDKTKIQALRKTEIKMSKDNVQ